MTKQFNPAPGWPRPPRGSVPPPGWRPPSSWPPAPRGWQFWIQESFWQRHPRALAAAGFLTMVVVVSAQAPFGRTGSAPAVGGGTPTPAPASKSSTTPAAQPTHAYVAKVGTVSSSTNGLDPDRVAQASALGTWLTELEDLGFEDADVSELRELAVAYRDTKLGRKAVRVHLNDAASLIESGLEAADDRRYKSASDDHAKAASKLRAVASLVRADAKAAERVTGVRLAPGVKRARGGKDHLFPVATGVTAATVVGWVDGDTVDTSAGRVRLIGIDTPELKDQCPRARAAKEYAELLAPTGSTLTLRNPAAVDDRDRYGRSLRYVDVPGGGGDQVTDVGYSLLLSSLAVARYDSRDGYQWHPREGLYRDSGDETVKADDCRRNSEKAFFVLASALADDDDSPEYWRKQALGAALSAPYHSARKYLARDRAKIRAKHQKQDRVARERAAEQARREQQRQREQQAQRQRQTERQQQRRSDNRRNEAADRGKGGGAYPGYNGPRCYAPGGKTWRPC